MARTAKTAASNNSELSNALTRAEQAETALKTALAQIAELNASLALARETLVEKDAAHAATLAGARVAYAALRDELRAARPVTKPVSEAKAAYNARATAGRIAFAKATEARARNAKAFFAAHPDCKSATDSEIAEWVEAQGEATA
jgi:small-conductance mechanosensitive channel